MASRLRASWSRTAATAPGSITSAPIRRGAAKAGAAGPWRQRRTGRGRTKLQLLVRRSNAPVMGFYEHLGYEESAVAVLQKWLDPARERAFRENPDAH